MNIEDIALSIIGLFFVVVAIKHFIFYLKGGAANWDVNKPLGPQSWQYKQHGTHGEEVLLLRQAIGIFIFGIALAYWGFTRLTP